MADKRKSPILVLIVLIVVSLALAGGTFFILQKEKAKNVALQEELDDIKIRLKVTESKLDESRKTIVDLGAKLQQAESQIARLTTDLAQEKTSKDEALAKIEQIRVDLDQQKGLRQDLEKKVNQAQKDSEKVQAQLKDLEDKKNELEVKVKDLEEKARQAETQGVELGKIVVSPEGGAPVQKPAKPAKPAKPEKEKPTQRPAPSSELEGKILVINKDYSFAVINLGSKDGVDIGNVFSVYHSNQYLGDVKVEKVHDSMAAAGFVSADLKSKVNEGDKVVRKTK